MTDMKRSLLITIFVLPTMLLAKPVKQSDAMQIANNFMNVTNINENSPHGRIPKRMMRKDSSPNEHLYYLYENAEGEGYVIIAADDIAQPVLGFSDSGTIDDLPENVRWWLSEYDREIKWAIEQDIEQTEETKREWDNLLKTPQKTTAEVVVAPLIKTHWSQGTYYNAQCPYDETENKRCLTGCVATAMAQIMKYWNHPIKGRGSDYYIHEKYGYLSADFENTTYQWNSMPNDLTSSSSAAQKNAVATLMYHCGVSVWMNYGIDESGASAAAVSDAMKNHFWYNDAARLLSKNYYNPGEWQEMVKSQLDAGCPLFYSGGSHAFICDGYRSDDYFHFNWGWDSQDGYFSLSALKPTLFLFFTTGDFTYNQKALFNLYPRTDTITRYHLEMESEMSLPDSIAYGTEIHFDANVSNVGEKGFSGYIYVVVYKRLEDCCVVDSVYVESLYNYNKMLSFSIPNSFDLQPDIYQITLQAYDESRGGLWFIGNDYYSCSKRVIIYNPLEVDFDYMYTWDVKFPEKWYTGDSIGVITKINNNTNEPFAGTLVLQLVNEDDENISQLLGTLEMNDDAIEPHNYKIVRFNGEIKVPAGNYTQTILYRNSINDDWKLVGATEGHENPTTFVVHDKEEIKQYVILAQRGSSSNWFYMTSVNAGSEYTPHLEAVDAGTTNKSNIVTTNLEDKYIWEIEETISGCVYLKDKNSYVSWTSGNTAYMGEEGKLLTIENSSSEGQKLYYFLDGDVKRYLSLNKDTRYNYFSFYKGTQAQDLLVLEYGNDVTTATEQINNVSSPQKVLINGQLFILRDGKTYTVQGQEVK